jgi:hypothetical protein
MICKNIGIYRLIIIYNLNIFYSFPINCFTILLKVHIDPVGLMKKNLEILIL